MKNIGDSILVYKDVDINESILVNGNINSIFFDKIIISINGEEKEFNTSNGEAEDGSYIELFDINIPENKFKYLKSKSEKEGFHYCFTGYSNWNEIKDEEFQRLKNEYLEASKNLKNYIEEKSKLGLD